MNETRWLTMGGPGHTEHLKIRLKEKKKRSPEDVPSTHRRSPEDVLWGDRIITQTSLSATPGQAECA